MPDLDLEARLADDELQDALDMGDESWFWPVGGEKASVRDVLLDLQATRESLAAAVVARDNAQAALRDILALCNADEEAALRPAHPGFEPIEVPWTLAVRAIVEPAVAALDGSGVTPDA